MSSLCSGSFASQSVQSAQSIICTLISSYIPWCLSVKKRDINFSYFIPRLLSEYNLMLDLYWLKCFLNVVMVDPSCRF